jgi:hypothetical protein
MVSNDGCDGPIVEIKEDDTNICGVGTSMEESSYVLITKKLCLFQRLSILLSKWDFVDNQATTSF